MNPLIEIFKSIVLMLGLGLSILLFAFVTTKYKDKDKEKFNNWYNKVVGVKETKFNRL